MNIEVFEVEGEKVWINVMWNVVRVGVVIVDVVAGSWLGSRTGAAIISHRLVQGVTEREEKKRNR